MERWGGGGRTEEEMGKGEEQFWPPQSFPWSPGEEAVDEAVRFYHEFPKLSLMARSIHFVFICFSCEVSTWL